jgi:hypothetical protein
MGEDLGDPIEEAYRQQMEATAIALDRFFNGAPDEREKRRVGFVLLVFEFGEQHGRCNYISNGADRKDICTLFREQIKRFEGAPDVVGHA